MAQNQDTAQILQWTSQPAFSVEEGMIRQVNYAAQCCMIEPGTPISELLETGTAEYAAFSEGILHLSIRCKEHRWTACIQRAGSVDLFILNDCSSPELSAVALAARELREPLSDLMAAAELVFPMLTDAQAAVHTSHMNQSLYQLLRIISNMSDTARYQTDRSAAQEIRDVCALLEELFQKAAALAQQVGIRLEYCVPAEAVYTLVDTELLERGLWNILSNSLKFTPPGGTVTAKLQRRENRLYLTVTDTGSGIPQELRGSVYTRYQRQPMPEDRRYGIGLGMSIVCAAARAHGGSVLLQYPQSGGARLTLTMTIRQKTDTLHSNVLSVDYAGEWDHALLELSQILPAELYEK